MRSILIGLIALAASCAPAFAQTINPGAQRFAHIVLVDTGMFEQAIGAAKEQLGPSFRQGYQNAPWATGLDADKRAKVGAYVDTIPDLLSAALMEALPEIETAVATAYSRELKPQEADQIANYLGSEDGLAFLKAATGVALSTYKSGGRRPSSAEMMATLTPKQQASLNAFARTPGGRAFTRVGGNKARTIMRDAIAKDVMPAKVPALRARIRTDLCAIIGDPCLVPMP
ncbi:MAG TPA: hypothetical protein VGO52_23475 [Hyphomonadaceae bacterium]|nr:hypothetical protein [Hyphomonadaceae bacterium]